MKLTLANKPLTSKPKTNTEKAAYFKNLTFKTGTFTLDQLKQAIQSGYTITYLYKDSQFTRDNNYMKSNFVGTQYICVDVDKVDSLDWIDSLSIKPTIWHTSFSNLTLEKDNKYCVHLIYCFDQVILGESDFNRAFSIITSEYADKVDKCAKDCHRVIFTSNSNLPNFQLVQCGNVIKVSDLFTENKENSIDTFFNDSKAGWDKKINTSISTTSNNMQVIKKLSQVKDFTLDSNFFADLNGMTRKEFITKYSSIFIVSHNTLIPYNGKPYTDLSGIDYYEVMNKYRWNAGLNKFQVIKIQNGNRTKQLFQDAINFCFCNPSITKEELVFALIKEVFECYNNIDGELNNYKVISIAKDVYFKFRNGEVTGNKVNKKFKVNNQFFIDNNLTMTKQQRVAYAKKAMTDDLIGSLIDLSATLEENLKTLKENGCKATKKRLKEFLDRYELQLETSKDIVKEEVKRLHKEFPTYSSRTLEKAMLENGYKISYRTIQRIL